jgi:heat shock protein HtpX
VNRTRTFFLMVLLTILFMVIGGAVGGREGAGMAFFPAVMSFFSYGFSDKIILKRCAVSEVGAEDQALAASCSERSWPALQWIVGMAASTDP